MAVLRDSSAGALGPAGAAGWLGKLVSVYEHTIRQQLTGYAFALGGAARTGAADCASWAFCRACCPQA